MDYAEVLETINIKYENTSRRINEIIRVFKKGINKFDYGGDSVGLSLLLDEIIIYRRKASKKEVSSIDKRLSSITAKIDEILESKPDYIKQDNPNYKEISHIFSAMSTLGLIASKKRVKESNQMYKLLKFIFFNSKDLGMIKRVITEYPDIVNSLSVNDLSIVEEILDRYIANLESFGKDKNIKSRNNLLFYEEVLRMLLVDEDSKYILTDEVQEKALVLLDKFLSNNIDNHDNEFMIWIHKALDSIISRKEKLTEEELETLTGVHREFPDDIMFVIRHNLFPNYYEEVKKREHNDEYIVTIDGEGATVLDDGLSAKPLPNGNFLLGVHIADPFGYIGPKSELIEEAFRRTRSAYFGRAPIHIFPDEVYRETSLDINKDNLALSYYLEIDPNGNVVLDHFEIKKEVVNVDKKLTNNGLDKIVKSCSYDPKMDETIMALAEITNRLKKRIKLSSIDNEQELLSGAEIAGSEIVQYSMFITNMTVANCMAKSGNPFIYIANGQRRSYFELIECIQPDELPDRDTRGLYKQLRNNPGKSFYTTNPKQVHQALGGIPYSRVTSPLIIFGDFLATQAIHSFYFGEVDPVLKEKTEEEFQGRVRYMNHKTKSISFYEGNFHRTKQD